MTPSFAISLDNVNYQPLLRLQISDNYGNAMETTSSIDTSLFSLKLFGGDITEANALKFKIDSNSQGNSILLRVQDSDLFRYSQALMLENPYSL